jgi:hypothetical protein
MRRGNRNMYNLTGQPGWMRLGYSPGWVGRSASGLGPCAEYLVSGRWPAGTAPFTAPTGQAGIGGELELLRAQADRMEQTLNQLRERIRDLEEAGD